jgi:hypothetical protein
MAENVRVKPQSWDESLAGHTTDVQAAARVLEDVIRTELPDVVVQYDSGNGLLAFGRSMRMRDLLFALIPHTGSVNLQLADGALLPNPDGLIEGTGKRIRHIKVRSGDAVDDRVALARPGEVGAGEAISARQASDRLAQLSRVPEG